MRVLFLQVAQPLYSPSAHDAELIAPGVHTKYNAGKGAVVRVLCDTMFAAGLDNRIYAFFGLPQDRHDLLAGKMLLLHLARLFALVI